MRHWLGAAALVLTITSAGYGEVLDVAFTPVDNSSVAELNGYVTTDIEIGFTGQFNTAGMLLELTQGSIYQDANGSNTAPSGAFIGFVPSLEFDTFVTLGGTTSDTSEAVPSVAGGAVDLGGASEAHFDSSMLNIQWFPPGGTVLTDRTEWPIARLSLSDDAIGSLGLVIQTDSTNQYRMTSVPVRNGQIVPEPGTLAALLAGLAALALRRRRLA